MDQLQKLQSDKLKRAYGEIIELKAEVAILKKELGFEVPKSGKYTSIGCQCLRNVKGYQSVADNDYLCNQCHKAL